MSTSPKRSTLQIATEARAACNRHTPKQRAASIKRGMELIEQGLALVEEGSCVCPRLVRHTISPDRPLHSVQWVDPSENVRAQPRMGRRGRQS